MLFALRWMYRISWPFATLRRLVGLPYMEGSVPHEAEPPAADEAIVELARTLGPMQFVVVGYVVYACVLWLMVFRPF